MILYKVSLFSFTYVCLLTVFVESGSVAEIVVLSSRLFCVGGSTMLVMARSFERIMVFFSHLH